MKPLYLIVGLSGSGKDTIVDELTKIFPNKTKLKSLTTRERRPTEKATHLYITDTIFHSLNLAAKTKYAGNWYGATYTQIDDSDFYIIDMNGLYYLEKHYKTDRPIYTIAIVTPERLRKERIIKRDGKEAGLKRLENDKTIQKNILAYKDKFDLIIVNKDLQDAISKFKDFIIAKENL